MNTIADPARLANLTDRLTATTANQPRMWGSISAQQMLVHLADGAEAVLKRRPFSAPMQQPKRLHKWIGLYLPVPWPRGIRSGAEPGLLILPPEGFAADRARAVRTLEELAAASAAEVVVNHPIFGSMSPADWQRWAFLHTDHHLRQFGL